MKLTEIAIYGPTGGTGVHLPRISDGLNVVASGKPTRGAELASFLEEVFFGTLSDARQREYAALAPASNGANRYGYVQVASGGQAYRLERTGIAGSRSELAVSDTAGNRIEHRVPAWLSSIDRDLWRKVFQAIIGTGGRGLDPLLIELLARYFGPSSPRPGRIATAIPAIDQPHNRLELVESELGTIREERDRLVLSAAFEDRERRNQLVAIEHEINDCLASRGALETRIGKEREQLNELDRRIAALRDEVARMEPEGWTASTPDAPPDLLRLYYERLDEVDGEIRRWRAVQADIQRHRLRLRDEMTADREPDIESREHPWHDARAILVALEEKILQAEQLATRDGSLSNADHHQGLPFLCAKMRDDLKSLCEELSQRYRHVRYRGVAAEMKQLRRCYREMEESVQRLLQRRGRLVAEIRDRDSEGAAAIACADREFIWWAEQHGYLDARNRYVAETPGESFQRGTTHAGLPDWNPDNNFRGSTLHADLAELQARRAADWSWLKRLESELGDIEPRSEILARERIELIRLATVDFESRIRSLDQRRTELERERARLASAVRPDEPAGYWQTGHFLADAARYLQRLSDGRYDRIVIDAQRTVFLDSARQGPVAATTLAATEQSIVRLSLCLAAIQALALRGVRLPLLVTETRGNLDDRRLYDVLESFTSHGHQVIIVTASASMLQVARQRGATWYELPDTEITAPLWSPDPAAPRIEPEGFPSLMSNPTVRPLSRHEFPTVPVRCMTFDELLVSRGDSGVPQRLESPLEATDIVETIYHSALASVGVFTVGDLIELNLEVRGPELARRGFSTRQLARWQSVALLTTALNDLHVAQARVLADCGIVRPETLAHMEVADVLKRIDRQSTSLAGRRGQSGVSPEFIPLQIQSWIDRLRRNPATHALRPAAGTGGPRTRGPQSDTGATRNTGAAHVHDVPARATGHTGRAATAKPYPGSGFRFLLDEEDPLESAPSIGPKTAERLRDIGIETVRQFLDADAADMAAQLDNRRLSRKLLGAWQAQSRLMCAVPNLHGHDVQILTSCGITSEKELAARDAGELLATTKSFVKTKEGERVLRNNKAPDLAEVTGWIDAARHGREIHAA